MNISLICVGSIKEKYFKDAIYEYSKRLNRYVNLDIIEVKDEKTIQTASSLMIEKIKNIEAERILSKIKDNKYIIALDILGKKYDSEKFSKKISELEVSSKGNLCFIIGGSLGLSKEILALAKEKISFSDMTFPHQLMRLIFLEQIYRAYKIKNNEPYHK